MTKTLCAEVQDYYEKVAVHAIDLRIRDQVRKVADKVADKIISEYHITRLVTTIIKGEDAIKAKLIIGLEVEKKEEI